jgi:hypothetical protein
MKTQQAAGLIKQIKQGLIFAGSIVAGCIVTASPSQAFTFAASGGFLSLSDFEPGFSDNLSSFADSFAVSAAGQDASAIALANALANLSSFPTSQTEQASWALAFGEGTNYLGVASGFSAVGGSFAPTSELRFNFTAVLGLISGSDQAAPGEFAQASGRVGFGIFDESNNPLDLFNLAGLVSSQGANLFSISNTPNLIFDTPLVLQGGDGATSFGLAIVQGSYYREFDSFTALSIQGETDNSAIVAVPTPALLPALLLNFSAIVFKRRRKSEEERVL